MLRLVKGTWEQVGQGCAAIPTPADEHSAPRVAAVKQALKNARGVISVGLPSRETMYRVAMLPSVDPDELAGMAELQMDKFSPLQSEAMLSGAEVLAQGEASSLVAMAATKREVVDELGVLFSAAGGYPDWVDMDALGRLHLLKQAGRIPALGVKGFLILDKGELDLMVVRDGTLLVCQALTAADEGEERSEWVDELLEDMGFTFTMLETEWGGTEPFGFEIWRAEDQPADDLQKRIGGLPEISSVSMHALGDLPSISSGLAWRVAEPVEPLHLDLAPPEWRDVEKNRLFMRRFWQTTLVFVAVWVLVVATFEALLRLERGRVQRLQNEVAALEAPALDVSRLQGKVMEFRQYADRTHSALECLRVISADLPRGMDLTSYIYRKENTLTLRGETDDAEKVYNFIQALERTEMFPQVKSDGITTRAGSKSQFGVTIGLPSNEPLMEEEGGAS